MWGLLRRLWRPRLPEVESMAIAIPTDSQAFGEIVCAFLDRTCPRDVPITWLCIGTDDCLGDALGPYTGTLLERMGIGGVIGTLKSPVNADNLERVWQDVPRETFTVAIDAMISQRFRPGTVLLHAQPIRPGEGVHRNLQSVGNAHIAGIVSNHEDELLRCPMGLVIDQSEAIAGAIARWVRRR